MKIHKILLLVSVIITFVFSLQEQKRLPDGFVYVKDIIPDLNVQLRYFSTHNFVGDTIAGYKGNRLILTKQSAEALKKVQNDLQDQNLCLMVYDGYRPQRAVNHFSRWANDLNDTLQKREFYPKVNKRHLFRDGYIASRSGHSRGSTLDLTIIDGNTNEPIDMGSPYDFFGKESWVDYPDLTKIQLANRQLLQNIMLKHNFRNYPKEWWHFTLRWEPFPETFFDFEVE
ncbi:M15 family metallopeptidase [Psychroserpens burtonensis]|uniref:D-alanyl-D-alanine dipeptidase n=1 Tax=Psychroserpens burtonensis TaxID=49278 RepID=A0A5C7BEL3_9FLAO|nr:M15 family metallopeptidase [Psychroserpens burtonensis]TXE16682.1 M15 family metallopeptidase [Psychroserpens burtonensis]